MLGKLSILCRELIKPALQGIQALATDFLRMLKTYDNTHQK